MLVLRDGAVAIANGEHKEEWDGIGNGSESGFDGTLGAEGCPRVPAGGCGGHGSGGNGVLDRLPCKLEITGEMSGGGRGTRTQGMICG